MIAPKSGADWTERMTTYSQARVAALARLELSGYVLKRDSPSCGMERVKVHTPGGMPERIGSGIYATALRERIPTLPVEEEGRLCDPRLRENFVERVFAYRRLRALFAARWTAGHLVRFHTAHKLVLLAHQPTAYTAFGRLVAGAGALPRARLQDQYEQIFMEALARVATPARHANVLQHIAGYFRDALDAGSRAELAALIDDHRTGRSFRSSCQSRSSATMSGGSVSHISRTGLPRSAPQGAGVEEPRVEHRWLEAGGWRLAAGGCGGSGRAVGGSSPRWRRASEPRARQAPAPSLPPPAVYESTMPEGDTIYRVGADARPGAPWGRGRAFHIGAAGPHAHRRGPTAGRPHHRARVVAGEAPPDPVLGDLVLRTHMRMNGSWHIYRPGERWRRPRSQARLVIETDAFVAVAFNVPVAEFYAARELEREPALRDLGPDLLGETFDEAGRRRTTPGTRRGSASATRCSISGHWRESATSTSRRSVSSVASTRSRRWITCRTTTLHALVQTARRLLQANVAAGTDAGIATYHPLSRTTGGAEPEERLWVYGRARRPCRRCRTPIERQKQGPDARSTVTGALSVRGRRSSSGVLAIVRGFAVAGGFAGVFSSQ